jgi:hypothetical protein
VIDASDYRVMFVKKSKNYRQPDRMEKKFECIHSGYDYSLIDITKTEINMSDVMEIRVEFCQSNNGL